MLSALSQAWASWKTAPGVALLAVVAFAVGIGSAAAVRGAIRQADPTLVMENVRTIHDIVLNNLLLERLGSLVMTFFGMAALLMATLGIYGVVSYFVRQRTVELGTRMALGAVNRDLVALVLGGGLKLTLAGIAVGPPTHVRIEAMRRSRSAERG